MKDREFLMWEVLVSLTGIARALRRENRDDDETSLINNINETAKAKDDCSA